MDQIELKNDKKKRKENIISSNWIKYSIKISTEKQKIQKFKPFLFFLLAANCPVSFSRFSISCFFFSVSSFALLGLLSLIVAISFQKKERVKKRIHSIDSTKKKQHILFFFFKQLAT